MPTNLRPIEFLQSENLDLANGTAEFYETGTTTPKIVYDKDGGSLGTSVALDSKGRADVFTSGITKVITKDSIPTIIDTFDGRRYGFGGFPDGWVIDVADQYGGYTDTEIAAAIAAKTGVDAVFLLKENPGGNWSISADITFESTHQVIIPTGVQLDIGSGKTVTFQHPDLSLISIDKHFSALGSVIFPDGLMRFAEWWGAVGDGVTDDDYAIQLAMDSSTNESWVRLLGRNYLFDTTLDIPNKCRLEGSGVATTTLTKKSGATGDCLTCTGDADDIVLKDFLLDCDFRGTNGIELGQGTGLWGGSGFIENVRVIDCAGIGVDLNCDRATVRNLSVFNTDGGSVGTYQVRIDGDFCNIYDLDITGENGTTACLGFLGNNINIFGMYLDDPHLTKAIRFNGGDNNTITGLNIVTEDNTKTYTQLIYFESGSTGNAVRDVKIEKGATDIITNSVQDDEYSNTIVWSSEFNQYSQNSVSFSVHKNGSDQSIPTATPTKLTWSTEEFDTHNDFDSNRFTPTVPGKYYLNGAVSMDNITDGQSIILYLYKNGVAYKIGQTQVSAPGGSAVDLVYINVVVDADGTSDYFELFIFQGTGGARDANGLATYTYFTGSRIGD